MGESQLTTTEPKVYERLIDRIGLALESARTAATLSDRAPAELELRGLSLAEFAVIRAWLSVHAPGRLAQGSREAPAPASTARIIWLKDRKRPAGTHASHARTSR